MEEKKRSEPFLMILSAPSGSGKTTLVRELIKVSAGVERTVSHTTRKPREGEENGRDYIFISDAEFDEMISRGAFLEWEENFGYRYGTSKEQISRILEKGNDAILSIDVKGARTVKKEFPQSISVFVMPPSMEELETRLRGRNSEPEHQLEMRLKESRTEVAASDEYEFLVINEDLDKAVEELRQVLENERANRKTINQKAEK